MAKLMLPYNGANSKTKKLFARYNNANAKIKSLYESNGATWTKIFQGIAIGDAYILGGHNWMVVNVDAVTGQAIIVCTDDLGTHAQNPSAGGSSWSDQTQGDSMRYYLNYVLYPAYSAEDRAKIVQRTNTQGISSSSGYILTTSLDYVWLLSVGEIFAAGYCVTGGGDVVNDGNTQLQWFATHDTIAERRALFGEESSWTRNGYDNGTNSVSSKMDSLYLGSYNSLGTGVASTQPFKPALLINP